MYEKSEKSKGGKVPGSYWATTSSSKFPPSVFILYINKLQSPMLLHRGLFRASVRSIMAIQRASFSEEAPATVYNSPNPRVNPRYKMKYHFYDDPHNDTQSFGKQPRIIKMMKAYDSFHVTAKKIRHTYLDQGYTAPHVIEPLRMRQPEDSLESLKKRNQVPCVIKARDEFEQDIWFVLPARRSRRMASDKWFNSREYYVKLGRETIRCTVTQNIIHPLTNWPVCIEFQRYIPGRPNLLNLRVVCVNLNFNLEYRIGALFNHYIDTVKVWCYNETYPAIIEADMLKVSVKRPYKIGDIERDLPPGMFLHKCYNRRKHEPIARLMEAPAYKIALENAKKAEDKKTGAMEDEFNETLEQDYDENKEKAVYTVDEEIQQYMEESAVPALEEDDDQEQVEKVKAPISRDRMKESTLRQIIEEEYQMDEIEPENYEYMRMDVMRRLGIKKPRKPKIDVPELVKSGKQLNQMKKNIDIKAVVGETLDDRPKSTGNRPNKKLHAKRMKRQAREKQLEKLKEEGRLEEPNLLEKIPPSKKQRREAAKAEVVVEEKQDIKRTALVKRLKEQLAHMEREQNKQNEMQAAKEDALKKGLDLRQTGIDLVKKKIKDDSQEELIILEPEVKAKSEETPETAASEAGGEGEGNKEEK